MVKLIFPCNFIGITQGYKDSHRAIDLGHSTTYGGPNHDIISPADGTVIFIKNDYNRTDSTGSSYGNYIKIDHGDGVVTLMAHLKYNSVIVNVGDKVIQGQKVGSMGTTGHSTGIHCHYEVRINNERYNPLDYTYASRNQYVTSNTDKSYNINYLSEEVTNVNDNVKTDNILFEYNVTKTGTYKIQLNENEKLVIMD